MTKLIQVIPQPQIEDLPVSWLEELYPSYESDCYWWSAVFQHLGIELKHDEFKIHNLAFQNIRYN
jgi:hypothetical protein